jgi:hypothetical protein
MNVRQRPQLLFFGCALAACTSNDAPVSHKVAAVTDVPVLGVPWTRDTTITTGWQDHSDLNTATEFACKGGYSVSYDLHLTNVMQNSMHIVGVTVHVATDYGGYSGNRVYFGGLRFYSQDGTPADIAIDVSPRGSLGNGQSFYIPVDADISAWKTAPDGGLVVGMEINSDNSHLDAVSDGYSPCGNDDAPYLEPQGVPGMNSDFSMNWSIANAWSSPVGWVAINGSTAYGAVHTWPRGGCYIQNFHAPDPGASGGIMWSPNTGAHWMHGQVFKKYVRYCDTQNLGCPVGPEQNNGSCRYWQDFEGGRVTYDRCPGGYDHSQERCQVAGGAPWGNQNDDELDDSIFP